MDFVDPFGVRGQFSKNNLICVISGQFLKLWKITVKYI